jgi:hypothetical protein
MMDELETMKIVAAAWQQQAHALLEQVVAQTVRVALDKREPDEAGDPDPEG